MQTNRLFAMILAFVMLFSATAMAEAPVTYTGEAQGFGGVVTVELTMTDGVITDVAVTGDGETPAIGGAAFETIKSQILAANSAEIDGVAGATITCDAAREATKKALNAANGVAAEAAALKDGVYTVTRESYQKEHVTVSVTIADGKIANVVIDEITDNPSTITDIPCVQIPAEIVANQTYNVDAVTGATVTSNSIKLAVRDCLEQAGGADAFSAPVAKPELVVGEDVETDVLIVGGGSAGMSAAMEACSGQEFGTTSGIKVMMIEKAAFLGGTTSVSGGGFTTYLDETGAYDKAWIQKCVDANIATIKADMQEPFNSDLHRTWMLTMKRTNDHLAHNGIPTFLNGYINYPTAPENGEERKWIGSYFAKHFNNFSDKLDLDLRVNTAATDLLVNEKGEVIGVSVQDKTSTYNIYAKKVILACGGFANNPELVAKYAPDYDDALVFCQGTNTGDGFIMATKLGAGVVGSAMLAEIGVDNTVGIRPDWCMAYLWGGAKYMMVNRDGVRFCNEYQTGYEAADDIVRTEGVLGWAIVDAESAAATNVGTEYDLKNEYCYKADTLEELAEMIGVPVDTFAATVKSYNAAAAGEIEDEFGGTVDTMNSIDDGPYFALKMRTCMLSSLVAVTVDENCRVLTEQGEVIPNLFAAGDMVLGNILKIYNSGHGVGNALYTGNMAAQTAKAEISAK